jgi:sec-independent protein translocase protein TatB
MFDFGLGSSELLLVAIVALIVIGPKDLPRLLRTMGQYMRKIQGMAREFQNHLNEAAKETGIDDVKKDIKGMTNFTVTADLDKQGAEIKKAIESSATKASSANGARTGGSATNGADKAKEPAKIEAVKPSPAASDKAAPKGSETVKSSKPEPKAKAAARPKAAPKPRPEAKPKPAARTKSKPAPKADRPRETAKS